MKLSAKNTPYMMAIDFVSFCHEMGFSIKYDSRSKEFVSNMMEKDFYALLELYYHENNQLNGRGKRKAKQ